MIRLVRRIFFFRLELRMKWRVLDRGVGETLVRAKVLGSGIFGNNVKRVGSFILGKFLIIG